MILRRVIEHFRKQEWTAIAIDFVIVVLGVFVGIQVSNWNAARKDRQDERQFLARLHSDIETAERLSMRVRDRRIARWEAMGAVTDIIFRKPDIGELTAEECNIPFAMSFYNVSLVGLPSLTELISSGRVSILRDDSLRAALVTLQQAEANLSFYIGMQNNRTIVLSSKYPELIELESFFDEELDEVGSRATCDLSRMRADKGFLNDYSVNADMYDGYMRDAFVPWTEGVDSAHRLLDAALKIEHGKGAP